MRITQNMQVHTTSSSCAKPDMEIDAIVAEAAANGLSMIGLTDHVNVPEQWHLPADVRSRLGDVPEGLTVLVGCEAQMLDPDTASITPEVAGECEVILIACNHYHLKAVENPVDLSPAGWAAHHLRMIEGAIDTGFCDIIPHPFVLQKVQGEVDVDAVLNAYDEAELTRIITKAAENHIAFELNPGHVKVYDFLQRVVKIGQSVGCKFSIGSDAHRLPFVGYNHFEGGIDAVGQLMERIGLREEDVWQVST